MKHIKLFEQLEDEEDWWDKESPFDIVLPKMKIIKIVDSYYLMTKKTDDVLILYNDLTYTISKPSVIDYDPYIRDGFTIAIYDPKNIYRDMESRSTMGIGIWKYCRYINLPEEIKRELR